MTSGETITISKAEYQQFLDIKSENEWLKHQLDELKRMIYGSKRERFITPDPLQSTLFDLPVVEAAEKKQKSWSMNRPMFTFAASFAQNTLLRPPMKLPV